MSSHLAHKTAQILALGSSALILSSTLDFCNSAVSPTQARKLRAQGIDVQPTKPLFHTSCSEKSFFFNLYNNYWPRRADGSLWSLTKHPRAFDWSQRDDLYYTRK